MLFVPILTAFAATAFVMGHSLGAVHADWGTKLFGTATFIATAFGASHLKIF